MYPTGAFDNSLVREPLKPSASEGGITKTFDSVLVGLLMYVCLDVVCVCLCVFVCVCVWVGGCGVGDVGWVWVCVVGCVSQSI